MLTLHRLIVPAKPGKSPGRANLGAALPVEKPVTPLLGLGGSGGVPLQGSPCVAGDIVTLPVHAV